MVFSSLIFLYIFLPAVLVVYYLIPNTLYRKVMLTLASFVFYAWGEPLWITVMVGSSIATYFMAGGLNYCRTQAGRKALLVLSIVLHLSLLGFFKYINFALENISMLIGIPLPSSSIGLPIGISFFTFQAISYIVDVYRKEIEAEKSLLNVFMYISLFPQLIAGPIVRYTDIKDDIGNRRWSLSQFNAGINRFLIGLGKKVILANGIGDAAEVFLSGESASLSVAGAWFGISLFALQIYFDFSGYSDMAIGLGKMFGFNYAENFNYPYISRSAGEFWRRWNMTLGGFFRDYVYIPLGGNKRYYVRNLFIVWFLTGLWHGASWNFVLWGLYFGLFIWLERAALLRLLDKLPRWISHLYLLAVVVVGWTFFYFTDLQAGFRHLQIMFGLSDAPLLDTEVTIHFMNHLLLLPVALVAATPALKKLHRGLLNKMQTNTVLFNTYSHFIRALVNVGLLAVSTVLLAGQTYNPFFYFRF